MIRSTSAEAFVRLNRDVALRFAVRHGLAIAAEFGCDEAELIASISSHMRQALNEAADNPKPFPKVDQARSGSSSDEAS